MGGHNTYTTDLSRLLYGICPVPAVLDTCIHGIQMDSRLVKKGDLFVALAGEKHDAQAHLQDAIGRGAVAVLVEGNELNGKVHESGQAIELYLPNLRKIVGELASRFFRQPSSEIKVIGVTGTNGKTSVTQYVAQILELKGLRTGVIGTLGAGFCAPGNALRPLERTTPNVVDVHRYLAEMRDAGADCVAMEVSSHGLDQGRVSEVHFDTAVFTNLTRDHLDYHGTMESYGLAKRKLFEGDALRLAVLNRDDPFYDEVISALDDDVRVIAFTLQDLPIAAPFEAVRAELLTSEWGLQANVQTSLGAFDLKSELIGQFNLSNLLAAIAVCQGFGGSLSELSGASAITAVRGRMETFRKEGYPTVVVDYAHTPDALENILAAVRPFCKGHLRLMFGCGGDRDTGKRAEMARVAERMADSVVVTDDNPRTEDPEAIVADIIKGFSSAMAIEIIHSREQAIQQAISSAGANDIVVLAGKGHESYQEINDQRIAFDDLTVAKGVMGEPVNLGPEGATCD